MNTAMFENPLCLMKYFIASRETPHWATAFKIVHLEVTETRPILDVLDVSSQTFKLSFSDSSISS